MSRWIEKNSNVLLGLVCRHDCSEVHRFGDRAVEVTDLEVQVHHGTLLPHDWRPYRRFVAR